MRRGGDVTVFLRLDDKPIRRTSGIYEPDAVVVLDPTLVEHPPVKRGLKQGGTAIINWSKKPEEIDLGVSLDKLVVVDATQISSEVFGVRAIPIVNTIMMGAIAKATDWVKLDSLFDPIMHAFPGRIGELNVDACKRGFDAAEVA
jgi:2-oxoacid:acceptor oxidoreductase gamma subunit (pyruvate/2-ketoisovalerate family)